MTDREAEAGRAMAPLSDEALTNEIEKLRRRATFCRERGTVAVPLHVKAADRIIAALTELRELRAARPADGRGGGE